MPAPGVDETEVLQLCADVEAISAHPIAVSIVNAAKERGLTPVRPVSFKEIAGEGIVAQTLNGTVICGSKNLWPVIKSAAAALKIMPTARKYCLPKMADTWAYSYCRYH